MTARTYPGLPANAGPSFTYQYDLMGRMSGLSVNGTSQATQEKRGKTVTA